MIKKLRELKNLRLIEVKINKNLFFVCGAVTLLAMAMILVEFFIGSVTAPLRIEFFYLGVLLIYSLHKELVRWLGEDKVERQGEYFVYLWIGLTTFLYVVTFFFSGFKQNEEAIRVLDDSAIITLEVLAVFIFTRFLKLLQVILRKRQKC